MTDKIQSILVLIGGATVCIFLLAVISLFFGEKSRYFEFDFQCDAPSGWEGEIFFEATFSSRHDYAPKTHYTWNFSQGSKHIEGGGISYHAVIRPMYILASHKHENGFIKLSSDEDHREYIAEIKTHSGDSFQNKTITAICTSSDF